MSTTRTITDTVLDVVEDQKWWFRYKDSISFVASNLAWMSALGTVATDTLPRWAQLTLMVLGGIGTVAGFVVIRLTKSAVTPSMGPRLEAVAEPEPTFSVLLPEAEHAD